jgi:hypothetical protein
VLVLTVCFFLHACTTRSREIKAGKLLAEINEIASKKDNSVTEIPEGVRKDLSSENIQRFPDSRQNLEIAVRKALPYYENDLERFTLIAKKYEEMELLNLNPKYMESVSTQKRLYYDYAKGIELQKSRLELLLDPNIDDRQTLMNRSTAIESKLGDLKKEIESLEQLSNKNKISVESQK